MRFDAILLVVCVALLYAGCASDAGDTDSGAQPDTALPDTAGVDEADTLVAVDVSVDIAETEDTAAQADDTELPDTADTVPDIDTAPIIPAGCIKGDYKLYYGNMHSHTGNSDGEGTPETAFLHARDTAKLDILAVTDHLEQLYNYGLPDTEWPDCKAVAAQITTDSKGAFLAFCGFEYGSGFEGINSTGHNNVFFSEPLFPMVQTDFHDFYKSAAACPECVVQFNHPGDEATQVFNNFEFDPAIVNQMALFEFNGAGAAWDLYFQALAKGWFVSPMFNQDNHSANWGTANDHRSGIYMKALTLQDLHTAFKERRTFMSDDKNAVLTFMAQGVCWMGSQLSGVSFITLSAEASDSDTEERFSKLEFFDGAKVLVKTVDCSALDVCTGSLNVTVDRPLWYVVRATEQDGDTMVSAPIWMLP